MNCAGQLPAIVITSSTVGQPQINNTSTAQEVYVLCRVHPHLGYVPCDVPSDGPILVHCNGRWFHWTEVQVEGVLGMITFP